MDCAHKLCLFVLSDEKQESRIPISSCDIIQTLLCPFLDVGEDFFGIGMVGLQAQCGL